jgi:iron(III) transport system ATP-binding protein
MALADVVVVMKAGRFLQVGAPQAVHDRPASAEVARFVGRGAVLAGVRANGVVSVGALTMAAPGPDGPVALLVRPGDVGLGTGTPGHVTRVTYRGGLYEVAIRVGDDTLEADLRRRPTVGEAVEVALTGGWVLPGG